MKKLEKYFDQQHELVLKNLHIAQKILSEKPIHELRVSIKRIKALFGFLAQLLPETNKMCLHFQRFKKIFKATGALRDAQVQERLVLKCAKNWNLPAPNHYLQHIQQQQKACFKTFQKTAGKADIAKITKKDKLLYKQLQRVSAGTLYIDTEKLLRLRFKTVRDLVNNATEDAPLHEARKIIKSIYYVLHLVFVPATLQQYQDLKMLEETIGDWHDLAMLADNLQAFEQEADTDTDTQAFLTKIVEEKQSLQQKIPALINQELRCWKILGNLKIH